MEQSSSEKQLRIRKQFDSFCKTLLKNEMIDYERARSYRQKHEVSFSELTQEELSRLNTEDDYIAESEVFRVLDYDIEVKDELISEALKYLPEKKRNVILLSFFLDMTDTEIAKRMELPPEDIVIALESIVEPVSLYEPVYSDGGDPLTVMDQVRDTKNTDERWLESIALRQAIDALGAREKRIIELRFGLNGCREYTQKQVADMLGISQSYISRLEKKIINELYKEITAMS